MDNYILNFKLINTINVIMIPFAPIIYCILELIIGGVIIILCNKAKTSGKKLAIIGMQGAGKSTLYNMLKSGEPGEHLPTTNIEVAEFKVKNRDIKIKKGKDIGGGTEFIRLYYEDLIKENEIIIFIFNVYEYLNNSTYKKNTKDRLDFIFRKSKEYNKNMDNLVIIASHIDLLPFEAQKSAGKEILNSIDRKQYQEMFKTNFFVISIINKDHINKLVESIF